MAVTDGISAFEDTSGAAVSRPVAHSRRDPLVVALFVAAGELSPEGRRELARLLAEDATLAQWESGRDINPIALRAEPYRRALLSVASTLGRAPSTTEYASEYQQRLGSAQPLPSVSAVIRFFGSWSTGLAAVGLAPADEATTSWARRLRYGWRRYPRYPTARLLECLRQCAADLGRTPTVRDYTAWRDNEIGGEAGRRLPRVDIPHFRTIFNHFGSWPAAIRAAGLPPTTDAS